MAKTVLLRTRVVATRKADGEKILAALGLSASDAVNMLFAQVVARKGLPFPVTLAPEAYQHIPNQTTEASLREDIRRAPRHKTATAALRALKKPRAAA
jgi:addiction module RelB/DinJ family antitoxin